LESAGFPHAGNLPGFGQHKRGFATRELAGAGQWDIRRKSIEFHGQRGDEQPEILPHRFALIRECIRF